MHLTAGLDNMFNFLPKSWNTFFNEKAQWVTKTIKTLTYLLISSDAWKNKDMLDFVSRFAAAVFYPILPMEDFYIGDGISSGGVQIYLGQKDVVSNESRMQNIKDHWIRFKEMAYNSLFTADGWKKNWRIMTLKEPEDGHFISITGYGIWLGSFISMLFGFRKRNFWNKLGGAIRDISGFIGDWGLVLQKSFSAKASGVGYGVYSIIDLFQRMLPTNTPEQKKRVDTINHLNNLINNVSTFFFQNITREDAEEAEKSIDAEQLAMAGASA